MIEFLSNTNWITPQIDFLVFLQNLRTTNFEALNNLFSTITVFGEIWLPTLICAIVYWCFDEKKGIYLFSLFSINVFIIHFLKMIACVYRPWVLNDRVHPFGNSINMAKSYSFPSGHSGMASSVVGGTAYLLRKHFIICTLIIVLVLSIGFSRLWLGVHTPQDVLVGLICGGILVFALAMLIPWAEKNDNRYLYLLSIINITALIGLLYVRYFNVYPMDYVNGELLVNPASGIRVTLAYYGYALGLINGCYLSRKFFKFQASSGTILNRIIRGILGSLMVYFFMINNVSDVLGWKYGSKFVFVSTFITGFFITAIYPFAFIKMSEWIENTFNKLILKD